jgi:hypothetical protein
MKSTYAFIVGIERYSQPGWDITGPALNALKFAGQLLALGVIARNIHLFVDSLQSDDTGHTELARSGVNIESTTSWADIDTFWRSKLLSVAESDSRLIVFWSGHGVVEPDGTWQFICSDYTMDGLANRVFSATNFLRHLRSAVFSKFSEQIFFADTCSAYSRIPVYADKSVPATIYRKTRQFVVHARPEGEYARGEDDGGIFTEALLQTLNSFHDWPEPEVLVKSLRALLTPVDLQPFVISLQTPVESVQDQLIGRGGRLEYNADAEARLIPQPGAPTKPPAIEPYIQMDPFGNPMLVEPFFAQGAVERGIRNLDILERFLKLKQSRKEHGIVRLYGNFTSLATDRSTTFDNSDYTHLVIGEVRIIERLVRYGLEVRVVANLDPEYITSTWTNTARYSGRVWALVRKLDLLEKKYPNLRFSVDAKKTIDGIIILDQDVSILSLAPRFGAGYSRTFYDNDPGRIADATARFDAVFNNRTTFEREVMPYMRVNSKAEYVTEVLRSRTSEAASGKGTKSDG